MILNIIKIMWGLLPEYSKVMVIVITAEIIFFFITLNNDGRIAMGIGILGLLPILIIALILSTAENADKKVKGNG